MSKLGFVGLGKMGSAMALRAVQTGYSAIGYNRTKANVSQLEDRVEMVPSIGDLCEESDTVIVSVTDDLADEDVTLGNHGLSDHMKSSKTILDFSTITPMTSRRINEKLKRKNIYRLETPVMGGPSKVLRGELVAMVGGDKGKYEENLETIRVFASRIFYGGNIGDALTLKLSLNLLVAGYAEMIAEGLTMVKKAKIDPKLFIQVLNATPYGTEFSETKGIKMTEGTFEPSFYLKNMRKDLYLLVQSSQEHGVFLPTLGSLFESYIAGLSMGLGDQDYSAIYKYLLNVNKLD